MKRLFTMLLFVFGIADIGLAQTPTSSHGIKLYTPSPPYPSEARIALVTGAGECSVVFDAAGHIKTATMIKSTGSKFLDENTVSYVLKKWTGPANTKVTVPIKYLLDSSIKREGTAACEVVYDGSGNAASAVMVRTTGSKKLDDATVSHALKHWTGKPNTTSLVPIAFSVH